jgi:HAD superfamily hydrolase (TIGR01509 family)
MDWARIGTGLVWDWDGTLAETEGVWGDAERATVEDYGGEWSAAFKATLIGVSIDGTVARIAEHVGAPSGEHAAIRERLLSQFSMRVPGRFKLKPGARALVNTLGAAGVPMALVSSSPREQVLAGLSARPEIRRWFPVTVFGDSGHPCKPDPSPLFHACAELGIDPRRSLAVDDSQSGVDAALALGMLVVSVPSRVRAYGAHHRVRGLNAFDLRWLQDAASGQHLFNVTG